MIRFGIRQPNAIIATSDAHVVIFDPQGQLLAVLYRGR